VKGQWPLVVGGLGGQEENHSAAVRSSAPSSTTRYRFLSMCMSSIPTRVSWAASNDLNPNMGRVPV